VRGTDDLRGAIAIDPRPPSGVQALQSIARVRRAADTPPRLIERRVEGTKRPCVNLDTLERGTSIEILVE
jgi:hypothetical protein